MPRPSSFFEQDILFTGNKDKSMDDIMNDRLLRKLRVEPLRPHKTPRLSPKSFHPMDDKIKQDELEKITYLEKQEKKVAQKINESLAKSQEFLIENPRTPHGWLSKVSKIYMEAQAREMTKNVAKDMAQKMVNDILS